MTARRDQLAIALDVDDVEEAYRLAGELTEFFSVAKVGLELFAAAGPSVIAGLRELGYSVFIDLKLHDIPTTVRKAASVLGGLGASFVTMHAAGGEAMLVAGVEGLRTGAHLGGVAEPVGLAVTVLTSDPDADGALLARRATLAESTGCGGIVCAGTDLELLAGVATGLLRVVPGTRPEGSNEDDQARVVTPAAALAAGAGLLVVGRVVTAAADPVAAAREFLEQCSL